MNILILTILLLIPAIANATSWKIDDLYTFTTSTNGSAGIVDADAVPTYRIYEDETGTAVLTGSMAKLDDVGTTGFYSEQVTLSAANGFEKGKSYNIIICAAISSTTACATEIFQIEMEVDSNTVSGTVPTVTTVTSGVTLAADAITAAKIAAGAIGNDEFNVTERYWPVYNVIDLTNESGDQNPTTTTFDTDFVATIDITLALEPLIYFPTTGEEPTQDAACNVMEIGTKITAYNTTTKVVTVDALPVAPDYRCKFWRY